MATFSAYTDVATGQRTITMQQADPVIEIAGQIVERADPALVSVGDGILTFHCSNGDISYGLREYDDLRDTWLGVRSDLSDEDLEDVGAHAREG